MNQPLRRNLIFFSLLAAAIAGLVVLPRARFLFEAAMLEFRILWWLLLLVGVGIYFGFLFRRNRDK